MKKGLLLAIAVVLSFGFTFSSDSNQKFSSDCPYLNKIHSAEKMNNDACPYLEKKVSKEYKSEMKSGECPYTGSKQKSEVECPYLKEKGEKANEEIKPAKQINLKSS